MPEQFSLGWRHDAEDRPYLRTMGQDFLRKLPMLGTYSEQVGDPRQSIKIENQGHQGSCTGHATSTIQEWLLYVETKGRVKIQLSRMFAYLMGQKECGLFGRDNGATISGSIQAAKKYGNCVEQVFPYPQNYDTNIPEQAVEDAKKRKIKQHQSCSGYDDVRRVVGSLFGGVNIGVMITQEFMDAGRNKVGVITPNHFKSRRWIGGHSMAILLPSKLTTDDGRPHLWGPQSWGTEVFNQGWMEWHPECFDFFAEIGNNEITAVTDIDESSDDTGGGDDSEFTGRTVDFITNNPHV